MDPISTILAIMLVIGLLKRAPDVLQNIADGLRNGARSAAFREQLRRLRRAGMAPVRRGPIWARMAANAYREGLAGRVAAAAASASRWGRRLDAAAGRAAERIRSRRATGGSGGAGSGGGAAAGAGPVRGTATVDRAEALVIAGPPAVPALPSGGGAGATGGSAPSPASPGPYRTTATVYTAGGTAGPVRAIPAAGPGPLVATVTLPAAAPAAAPSLPTSPTRSALPAGGAATTVLTGEIQGRTTPTTPALPAVPAQRAIEGAATMAVEVTGVVSGAAACRRVSAAITLANESYQVALAAARAEISSIIEQTLANVQFDGKGEVIGWLNTAAEAAAQASAAAATCGVEVYPALNRAAKAFDRRNS